MRVPARPGRADLAGTAALPLPEYLTRFVGREAEIRELPGMVSMVRLMTLTGVGGCGKTRLAVEIARRALDRFGRVVFVDLAPLADSSLLTRTIATAVGLVEPSRRSLEEALRSSLADSSLLLVLDNCEHLVEACGLLAERLLKACPRLTILATSREPLDVSGEATWRVAPLPVPPVDVIDPEHVSTFEGARLFLDRAALHQPGFALTAANAAAVGELCRRLDGLPLALELAAARLRTMPVAELLAHLGDRFRLLADGPRTAPARQRTLSATIEWSYALLDERERALFRRLTVFSGSFGASAARAICSGPRVPEDSVLATTLVLVDKSMLLRADSDAEPRFRLLETLREYGEQLLGETSEVCELRRRHADFFLALAEQVQSAGIGPPGGEGLRQLSEEQPNLRLALGWLEANDPDRLLRLSASLGWFWLLRGHLGEGRNWLQRALALTDGVTPTRLQALIWAAVLALDQDDPDAAQALIEQCSPRCAPFDDGRLLGLSLLVQARIAHAQADFARARKLCGAALTAFQRAADAWGVAVVPYYLALTTAFEGAAGVAEEQLEQSVPALSKVGDRLHAAQALFLHGLLELQRGNRETSRAAVAEGLRLSREIDNWFGIPIGLELFAMLAAAGGEARRALELAAAAEAVRRARGLTAERPYAAMLEASLDSARSALDPTTAAAAWRNGELKTVDEAVECAAAAAGAEAAAATRPAALTNREWEVALLVAQGLTNRQIAERFVISVRTAEGHVEHLRSKLGFHSRAQIAAWVAARPTTAENR